MRSFEKVNLNETSCNLKYYMYLHFPVCKEESHWVEGRASDVQIRVWAFDNTDSKADIGVHLGLRGVNITLMVKGKI